MHIGVLTARPGDKSIRLLTCMAGELLARLKHTTN